VATYYIRTTGNDSPNTGAIDSPWLTVQKALTYLKTHSDTTNIIDIGTGTFSTSGVNATIDHANHANLTIRGAGRLLTNLTSTANHTIYVTATTATGMVIQDLTAYSTSFDALKIQGAAGTGLTVNDVDLQTGTTSTGNPLHPYDIGLLNLNRVRLYWANGYAMRSQGSTVGIWNNVISVGAGTLGASKDGRWTFDTNSPSVTINGGAILDCSGVALTTTSATAAVTANNIILQGATTSSTAYIAQKSAGTLALNNCLVVGNQANANGRLTSGTTDTNCVTTQQPGFVRPMRGGIIVPWVDDGANYADAVSVGALLKARGMRGSYALNTSTIGTSGCPTIGNLQTMITDGTLEVACHGSTHCDMSYTHALGFTYTGAGASPTVAFDGTTITCTTTGDVDRTTYATTPGTTTLANIITAFNTVNHWTCALSNTGGQVPANLNSACLSSSLKTQAATAAPCDIDFDVSAYNAGYFQNEITAPKALLATGLGATTDTQTGLAYVCNTFAAPYNVVSAGSKAAIISASYTNARTTTAMPPLLSSIDLFVNSAFGSDKTVNADETITRQRARAIGFTVAQSGEILHVYGHSATGGSPDISLAQWGWMLDEWAKISNLTVTSAQLATAYIKTSGLWTDAGGGLWTRAYTMTDTSGLKLLPGSASIQVGTDNDGSTDFESKVFIGPKKDIGAYAFRNTNFFMF
jgi:hypothetical protein